MMIRCRFTPVTLFSTGHCGSATYLPRQELAAAVKDQLGRTDKLTSLLSLSFSAALLQWMPTTPAAGNGGGSEGAATSIPHPVKPEHDLLVSVDWVFPRQDLAAAVKEQLGGTSIYLVGMMGSGKSTVGKLLSAALGYYFFDSDSLVRAPFG